MRSQYRLIFRIIAVISILAMVLCGCGKQAEPAPQASAKNAAAATAAQTALKSPDKEKDATKTYNSISVAVYPYVPDVEKVQQLLLNYWAEIEPNISLEFVSFDAYGNDDPTGIDIIMYDALFLANLVENGYIQPIESSDVENGNSKRLLPFALDGAYYNEELYGIPFLVCSFFLIHDKNDQQLSQVTNYHELNALVAQRMEEGEDEGLQVNFDVDAPFMYLDALIDATGEYTTYDEIPDTVNPNEEVDGVFTEVASLRAADKEIEAEHYWNRYAASFNEGIGTAYIGYSEDLCDMDDILNNLAVRTISFSEKENTQMFFADVASIGSHVTDPLKLADCKKILNILASKDFLLDLCTDDLNTPYILPARQSVYAELKKKYPMYGILHKLVVEDNNKLYLFGEEVYTYLSNAANDLNY